MSGASEPIAQGSGVSVVRPAKAGDVPAVVDVHLRAFEGFFLSLLGPRFLKLMYEGFLGEPTGILLVGEERGKVAGFVAGTTQPEGFFRRLRNRRGLEFVRAAMPGLLRRPLRVSRRLLAGFSYRGEAPAQVERAALLSSIAVETKGSGLAGKLLEAFIARAAAAGCRAVYLTTDRAGNEAVNRFYERNGFALESSIVRDGGRQMNRYVKQL